MIPVYDASMGSQPLGLVLVGAGLLLVVLGLLAFAGGLSWFGRLPGDIRIEGADGRVQVFIPLASMLVLSLALTVVAALLRRVF